MGVPISKPIPVHDDNKSNLMLHSKDRVNFKGRSKHISRKYFGVFEHVDSRKLKLFWTGTDDLVTDYRGRTRREIQEIQDRDRTSRRKFKIQIR